MPIERPMTGSGNTQLLAQPVILVNTAGEFSSGKSSYTLLNNATATGPAVGPINGGDYVWRAEATTWNAATATLQYLGLDGTTWNNVRNAANTADVTLTANGSVAVGVGEGSSLRVLISGAVPTGVRSNLAGL